MSGVLLEDPVSQGRVGLDGVRELPVAAARVVEAASRTQVL